MYHVEFPAGTRSFFAGSTLEKSASYEFSTATPNLKLFFPPTQGSRGVPSNVVFIACFDQQINPSKFVQKVKISEGGLLKKAGAFHCNYLLILTVNAAICR
jgi:hypothetical protein